MRAKHLMSLMIALFIFSLCSITTLAETTYDYRQDTLANSEDYAEVAALDELLKGHLSVLDQVENNAVAKVQGVPEAQPELPYQNAVKEIPLTYTELITALNNDTLQSVLANAQCYSWIFPVMEGNGYRCAFADKDENGAFHVNALRCDVTANSRYEFAVQPQVVQQALQSAGIEEPEYMEVVACHDINASFIYVADGQQQYLIPFTGRSDLLGLNTKQVYPIEQAKAVLQNLEIAQSGVGGGIGVADANAQQNNASPFAAVLTGISLACVLGAAALFLLPRVRGRKKRS
ncbi:MAG TPA: hypothetical protein IAA58_00075 [Candidatus Gallacutalibacter stercoravium]|nr:hypothetical protein [Candidatus Gallacutalibacter stercoravium]